MSLELKRRFKQNLESVPVYIEDTSLTSEAYFGITEFPKFFGRGKNGVRVKPSRVTLQPGSELFIEILDVNGQSVYYEIPDYEPGDLSRYISVWVYGERNDLYNTPNGIGEVIICGIADRTENGEEIPDEFKNTINIRWRRKIPITRNYRSESPIIFSNNELPTISISESISSYLNFADENGQLLLVSESINETIVYSSDFSGENVFLRLPTTSSYNFGSNLAGNKVYFNLQNVTLSPTITSAEASAGLLKPINYTASVQSLIDGKTVRVSNPLTASVTTKFESILKTFTSFSTGSFTIEVPTTGSQTQFSQSLLHITLKDVNPIIGNVDKINVYIRPKSFETTNQYKFVGTKILSSRISSSITDIYSNIATNFTQSTHTFVYQAEKENDLNDIKVEFVNSLNDESPYFIEEKDAFLAGYNKIDSASYAEIQVIHQTLVTNEVTASRILLSNINTESRYSTNGGSTSSISTITFRDIGSTISSNQSIGRLAFESFDTDTSGSNSSQVARAFIEGVSEDTSPDAFLAFGTAVSGALPQERVRITSTGNVGIGTSSPTERLHVDGNLLVTGRITAEEFHTEFVSASIIYQSGSTQFGNSSDDTHQFTGSLLVKGNSVFDGSLKFEPTQDPDLAGLDTDSTILFQSSSNTLLGYDLYFRQNGNLVKWKWFEGILETGLLYGGIVTYSGSNVFVSPGSGIIVNHNVTATSEVGPIVDYVTWGPITQSITNISSSQVTYIYIDENGALHQQSTRFTSQQFHDDIPLGAVAHFNYSSISAFGGAVQTSYNQTAQIVNFIDAFGPLKLSGYGLTGQPSSLRLSVGSGISYIHGGFYDTDLQFPSQYQTNAQVTASIAYVYSSGSGIRFDTNNNNFYTSLKPNFYDPGTGTTSSVSNNNWTIQRVYSDPRTGVLYIYYGRNIYPDYQNAIANLSTDSFSEGDTFDFTTFLGFLLLKSNTNDITNTTDNKIIPAGLFRGGGAAGGGGSAVTTLDDLTNVTITSPTNGQALVYNAGVWENGTPISSSYSITASFALNVDGGFY